MRKCSLQAFSPFPTVFSKGLFCEQTLSSEEKILVTSIFFFSENAFKTFCVGSSVGSLKPRMANDKILDWSKMKAFADDNKCDSKIEICQWKDRKHLGKGENAGHQHFLFFPTMFSKGYFLRVLSRDCVC